METQTSQESPQSGHLKRNREYRQRQREAGLKRRLLWIQSEEEAIKVRAFLERIQNNE